MVFATVKPENGELFEAAFADVSARVRGTPGHLTDELLRDPDKPGTFLVMTEAVASEVWQRGWNAP